MLCMAIYIANVYGKPSRSVTHKDIFRLLDYVFIPATQKNLYIQGCSNCGGGDRGAWTSPTSISKLNKVQQFQFQTSGILLFMGVQKSYRPEMSRFFQCMLHFLDNLRWIFIFSNYMREIHRFTLDLLYRSDT